MYSNTSVEKCLLSTHKKNRSDDWKLFVPLIGSGNVVYASRSILLEVLAYSC